MVDKNYILKYITFMNSFTKTIAYSGINVALLIISAFISIPTTPPITLQLLMVLIICGLYNFKISFLSVAIYILLGIVGLPIFSGFNSGIVTPTGGFIIGFIFFPFTKLIFLKLKNNLTLPLAFLTGLTLLYIIGFIWLGYFLKDYNLALKSSLIFLPLDLLKCYVAIKIVYLLKKLNIFN